MRWQCLGEGGSNEDGEEWMGLKYILEIDLIGFTATLDWWWG